MSLTKILGIGLGIVGSLGAIGGITAAVITKQNATTSLNTVNNEEMNITTNSNNDQSNEKNNTSEEKRSIETPIKNEKEKQTTETKLLDTEKAPSSKPLTGDEFNEKGGFMCPKKAEVAKQMHQSNSSSGIGNGYKFCSVL